LKYVLNDQLPDCMNSISNFSFQSWVSMKVTELLRSYIRNVPLECFGSRVC
jgi:hypothetical protein